MKTIMICPTQNKNNVQLIFSSINSNEKSSIIVPCDIVGEIVKCNINRDY